MVRAPLLIPLLAVCALAQSSAILEGTVLSATGDPVRKATLRLQLTSARRGAVSLSNYTGASDAEGHFIFDDIEPGTYQLSAERSGYVRGYYGSGRTTEG